MLRALRRLLPYVRQARRSLGIGLICVLLTTAISLISPWILRYVIDDLNTGFSRTRLGGYALLLIGLAIGEGWFRYLMRQRIIGASREIEYCLRNDFFARLEELPLSYYQSNRT